MRRRKGDVQMARLYKEGGEARNRMADGIRGGAKQKLVWMHTSESSKQEVHSTTGASP